MKTIFLFLSNRAYTSDLLNTQYIRYLSEKYKIIVFLPEREGKTNYFQNRNIAYLRIPEPKGKFWTLFDVFLRNELIHQFDELPAVQWRDRRVKDRRRLFLRKLSKFLPKKIFSPDFFSLVEKIFLPGYKDFLKYVKKYKPAIVLTASPGLWPLDAYAVLAAKKAGLLTAAINFSWDNLTVYPKHLRRTDYLIVWNEMNKKEALELHCYKENQVFVSGILRFDYYFTKSAKEASRQEFLKSKNLDPSNQTILYAAKTQGRFYKDFIKSFIDWRNQGSIPKNLNLFIRLHPLDSMESYRDFFGQPNIHLEYGGSPKQSDAEKGQKIEMDEDDLINMKQTLKYCDLCLSVSSTVSVEACIFDKPVINIGFVPEFSEILNWNHYQPLVEKQAVRVANNMKEVMDYLNMYLKDPSIDSRGRKEIVETIVKPTDGFSYKRNVDFLDKILKSNE